MRIALFTTILIMSSWTSAGVLASTPAAVPRGGCPPAPALLSLRIDAPFDRCLHPGDSLDVTLAISCVDLPLTGYQAFIEFDPNALTLVAGDYVLPEPFGLPLILPIIAVNGEIDLAAGINPFNGQPPMQIDADLVHMVFQAASITDVTRLRFRVGGLPTRVSTLDGPDTPAQHNSPTVLVRDCGSCLWADLDCDGTVNVADFIALGDCLRGPNVPVPGVCRPADFDDDTDVDLVDFSEFQRQFANQ